MLRGGVNERDDGENLGGWDKEGKEGGGDE